MRARNPAALLVLAALASGCSQATAERTQQVDTIKRERIYSERFGRQQSAAEQDPPRTLARRQFAAPSGRDDDARLSGE